MPKWLSSAAQSDRLILTLVLTFLGIAAVGGGGSRPDVQSLLFVRTAAGLLICAVAVIPRGTEFRRFRGPLLFCGICAMVMILQLVPLPADLWQALPGRQFYSEAAAAAGQPLGARPISLTPDLTINALLSLLPPVAAIIGFAVLHPSGRILLLPAFIVIALASAVLGIAQVSTGSRYLLLYRVWSESYPVGLFANRNHQAVFLAAALPMIAVWATRPGLSPTGEAARRWLSVVAVLLLLPLVVVTGSRAGLLLMLLALLASFALIRHRLAPPAARRGLFKRWVPLSAMVLAPVAALGASIYWSRTSSVARLTTSGFADEARVQLIDPLMSMIRAFFPFGSGFGSFDNVFRRFEPFDLLDTRYFNHAHNDLLELLTDSGIFGALLLTLFLLWWGRRSFVLWSPSRARFPHVAVGRLGSVITALLLVASLFDYPLRTPLLAVFFATACCWMIGPKAAEESGAPGHSSKRRLYGAAARR